jgi:hypothetical protein
MMAEKQSPARKTGVRGTRLGNTTYRFHARWLTDHPKPEEVTRIFDSFRLLTKENNQ